MVNNNVDGNVAVKMRNVINKNVFQFVITNVDNNAAIQVNNAAITKNASRK